MKGWKRLKVGDPVVFCGKEFDGEFRYDGTVSAVYADHAIVKANGMNLWLDDDTKELFFRKETKS